MDPIVLSRTFLIVYRLIGQEDGYGLVNEKSFSDQLTQC